MNLWYIIIAAAVAIIGISIVVALIKYAIILLANVLFNPIVNSAISLCFFLFVGAKVINEGYIILVVPIGIIIVDCILDIVRGCSSLRYYYWDTSTSYFDKFYKVKSLTSIATFGFARIIFLLVVGPLLSHSVYSDIEEKIKSGLPFPDGMNYHMEAKRYYFKKRISKLEYNGNVVSNQQTVDREMKERQEKLDRMYPEKWLAKVSETAMTIIGDSDTTEMIETRKKAKAEILRASYCYAYLGASAYERYPQLIRVY